MDYQEKEFFIGSYLKDLDFKLPANTRFKVFKVKKRAVVNYEEINFKSLGYSYSDTNYGYNWPYDFFSLLEMAEVKAELNYDTEITEDARRTEVNDLGAQIQRAIQEATIASASGVLQTTTTPERVATNRTGVTELDTSTNITIRARDLSAEGFSTSTATTGGRVNFSSEGLNTSTTTTAPSSTSMLGGTGNTVTSTTTNTRE